MNVVKQLAAQNRLRTTTYPSNLFQLLAALPRDGVGARVAPEKWLTYGATTGEAAMRHHYEVTHVRLTPGMTQGIVSGRKTWNGTSEPLPTAIPHDLAYGQPWRVVE